MTPTSTVEDKRLRKVEDVIGDLLKKRRSERTELRFQLLEATASRIGGFELDEFQESFGICALLPPKRLVEKAQVIVGAIEATGIHPVLCLSALARESNDGLFRRNNGVYHTDFRLALHLARSVEDKLLVDAKVIDPACGAGMLLAAVSILACRSDRVFAKDWLSHSVYAADLSPVALRGTLLSLAALTDDVEVLVRMRAKWKIQDSLLAPDAAWMALPTQGFDLVVANPPWEKVKLTRHEYIMANGGTRHYGATYEGQSLSGYDVAKSSKARLATQIGNQYPDLLHGEKDLYVAFTELLLKLTRAGGTGAFFVPAGLIRSRNTRPLRAKLIDSSQELSFTVCDNRARHFAIDTRFKFLLVNYTRSRISTRTANSIGIVHARANDDELITGRQVKIPTAEVRKLRPDLSLPEVRTSAEWQLFNKMQERGISPSAEASPWFAVFCREVDMTHARPLFVRSQQLACLPVIEGRMVQPHRLGCKSYLSGDGRRARWRNLPPGESRIMPQFWIPVEAISPQAQVRVNRTRAGFCDITGQTNERSMMAALVPRGVVCGNKVPTVEFPNDPSEERLFLWLSIVNSLPFDWILRRVVTTTVNYFVIRSLRLPVLEVDTPPAERLIAIARQLVELDSRNKASFELCWRIARLRAEADVLVAKAYGCTEDDLRLMMMDFPLLDRGQPPLANESKSTVTSDLFFSTWRFQRRDSTADNAERVRNAEALGAIAYLSSEFSASTRSLTDDYRG